jgi:hypothetical protein
MDENGLLLLEERGRDARVWAAKFVCTRSHEAYTPLSLPTKNFLILNPVANA